MVIPADTPANSNQSKGRSESLFPGEFCISPISAVWDDVPPVVEPLEAGAVVGVEELEVELGVRATIKTPLPYQLDIGAQPAS
jgi:hypothetical protein